MGRHLWADIYGQTFVLEAALPVAQLRTRAATLPQYIWTAKQLEAAALRLMRAEYPLDLRLMGVR